MKPLNEQLRDFIVENFLYGQAQPFSDQDSFLEKGLIDSTGVLELVTFLEEQYGVTVDNQELIPDNLDSIASLCRFVERKRCDKPKEGMHAGRTIP